MGFPHSGLEYAISSHHLNSIICDNVVAILKRSVCVARCLTNKTPNSVSWGLYPQCGKHVRLQLCTQIKVVVTQSTLVTEYFQSQGYSKCDFYPQWLGKGFFKWQFKLNCLPQGVHCFCRQIENISTQKAHTFLHVHPHLHPHPIGVLQTIRKTWSPCICIDWLEMIMLISEQNLYAPQSSDESIIERCVQRSIQPNHLINPALKSVYRKAFKPVTGNR